MGTVNGIWIDVTFGNNVFVAISNDEELLFTPEMG
jgi:hypothetical protein